ncbi:DUF6428 family protein [Reichenbachiella agariperforans]|uniref:DUF6428 family protein n=1 Tax=Reichenbachiella agariperforans TaxID=156994 RepID=UPI001C093D98|nr:DUF6428 family protein [Reichenbachiella agariperforans]MBU2914264.1 hypothetical protein [Reichenbachiella agariperforans]
MKLSEMKSALMGLDQVVFKLPNGEIVPEHFHVTEVGGIHKKFIDCGGTIREEQVVNFQLWHADDHDHRLSASKLVNIISLSEEKLGIEDWEIEVEYQSDSIGKYGLSVVDGEFVLTTKQTACLAEDACGIPAQKPRIKMSTLQSENENSCAPGSGCC